MNSNKITALQHVTSRACEHGILNSTWWYTIPIHIKHKNILYISIQNNNKYRIKAVLKVDTYIIYSIKSPMGPEYDTSDDVQNMFTVTEYFWHVSVYRDIYNIELRQYWRSTQILFIVSRVRWDEIWYWWWCMSWHI